MRVTLQTMGVLPPTKVLSVQRWEPGLSVGAVEGGQKKRLSWVASLAGAPGSHVLRLSLNHGCSRAKEKAFFMGHNSGFSDVPH